jgi:hypothetical protein
MTGEEARVRPPEHPRARIALAVLVAVLGSGCGLTHLQDLNFRVDKRLHFSSPKARALVPQRFTVSWRMDDFTIAAPGSTPASQHAGYFAVFVDRAPIKPGQSMKAVASGDRFCQQEPTCPDRAYLRQRLVFTTTGTSLRLPLLPALTSNKQDVQLHSITIVLMDTGGHRIGESAWELDVRLRRVGV